MKQSPHQYPLFSDLIEAQKKSVLSFFEKGILEEFELFSYVQGKNIAMIFHGSKFFLQKPLFSFEYLVESQKTYSVSLFIPVEFQALRSIGSDSFAQASDEVVKNFPESTPASLDLIRKIDVASAGERAWALTPQAELSSAREQSSGPASGRLRPTAPRLSLAQLPSNLEQNFPRRLAPWIYCGEIPFMTERGNFLINGSARVLVNQIVRCPSVYFKVRIDQKNRRTYIGSFLSEYGSWLRLETDYKNRLWVRIDKSERFSIYALLRALGFPETFLKYQLKYYSFLFASQEEYSEAGTRGKERGAKARASGEAAPVAGPQGGVSLASSGRELRVGEALPQATNNTADSGSFVQDMAAIAYLPTKLAGEVKPPFTQSVELTPHAAVQSIWKKCNPNRWNSLHGCYTFVYTKFFHPKKYSIGSVGRGRLNKRLISGGVDVGVRAAGGRAEAKPSPPLPSPQASAKLAGRGGEIAALAEAKPAPRRGSSSVLDSRVNKLPTLTPEDIFMALDVLIRFHYGEGVLDDIDHLKNRRVRLPGELMQNQLRLALSRMTQASVDKLTNVAGSRSSTDSISGATSSLAQSSEPASGWQGRGEAFATPAVPLALPLVEQRSALSAKLRSGGAAPLPGRVSFAACIQTQVFSSTFKELFNTSQLSQYMDQTNPLAEITHKRRLSSLGPGGIAKDQAGVAVREIHPSHFGRICPIETPEGQNAGLVGSLATYCQLTSEGFLEAIYSRGTATASGVIATKSNAGGSFAATKSYARGGSALPTSGPAGRSHPRVPLPSGEAPFPQLPSTAHLDHRLPPNHQRAEWFIFQADTEDEVFISAEQYLDVSGKGRASGWQGKTTPAALPALEDPAKLARRSLHLMETWGAIATPRSPSVANAGYTPIRYRQEFFRVNEVLVEFFGVSPIQMISLATSLIPFLEHDDANRALMGSNMQRQAVPLMTTERAYVGTGLEVQAARDSTTLCCTQVSGQASWIDANHVVLQGDSYFAKFRTSGTAGRSHPQADRSSAAYHQSEWEYDLQKYWRSNQNTCIYQKPNYQHGAWIEKGRCIADGAASSYGEIALGKNIFVAYMPWEGFNFEDAIVINQRLVDEDIYTSIHIERYDIDVMDTEYGKEILGRDILNPRENGVQARQGIAHTYDSVAAKPYIRGRAQASEPASGRGTASPLETPPVMAGGGVPSGEAVPLPQARSEALPRVQSGATSLASGPASLVGKGEARNLDARGIILPGTWVEEDDILVGKMTPIAPPKPTPEYRLLLAIFETKPLPFRDTSLRVPTGIKGRILECIVKYEQVRTSNETVTEANGSSALQSLGSALQGSDFAAAKPYPASVRASGKGASRGVVKASQSGATPCHPCPTIESVQVFLVSKRKIQLGDKMSGRHGNKGIVSCILPPQDMPFVQDGSPLDIVLNPLGVPSRMNVGQVLECLFGFASKTLCENYRLIPFDEIYGEEASRGIVYTKLFEASKTTGYEWIFDPNHPGKTHIFDGRTGDAFHQPVLVGYSYMLKLIHQVDEKMHARSTGPYSLITQQPLGGRAKHGGQRLGEMEVWACEGFGASAVLHEFLTLKSDDIDSRNTFLFHVMKRKSLGRTTTRAGSGRAGRSHSLARSEALPQLGGATSSQRRSLPQLSEPAREWQGRGEAFATPALSLALTAASGEAFPLRNLPNQVSQPTTVPESFRVLVHELQSLCLSVYFHPEFRLTYPSLLGWDGLFVLPSRTSEAG